MANYIREPYSADLDFGTGEWSASAWANVPVSLPAASFPVVGSNLITNGTFDTNTDGWVGQGATLSVENQQLKIVGSPGGGASYVIPIKANTFYKLTIDVVSSSYDWVVMLGNGWGSGDYYSSGRTDISKSISSYVFSTSTTNAMLQFYMYGSGQTAFIDNISVTEVGIPPIADRSYSAGPKINFGIAPTGKLTATAYDGTTTRTVTTTAAYNTANWLKAEACYTTDGTLSIRVNGQQVAATYGAPLGSLNNSNAVLTIGNSYNLDAPFPGSLALLKLSATVPTAEQSQWMYEQEKQMFREGAQVTLPDSNAINDLTYDEVTDKWIAVSSTNMSEWSGLVRTNVTAVPSGSYSKLSAAGGVTLQARGSNVDITIPSYGLRKELVKRAESAAKLARNLVPFDYVGGFTASTTNGSTSITSVAGLSYPVSYVGAKVTGSGIPTDTVITAVSGTTIYLSKAATATATGVQISFTDFILPVGYEAKDVLLAGVSQKEGSTAAFTRLFDGFKETIRFAVAPSYTALVQIQAVRSTQ